MTRAEASRRGTRVKIKGRDLRVIDGPFTETKEVIGGYLVIDDFVHSQTYW